MHIMEEKKIILFVTNHLTIGGVQKSLVTALNAIDYSKNDVTLYIRKNRLALLSHVNKNVKVIINDDQTKYYREFSSVTLIIGAFLWKLIKKDKQAEEKINALATTIKNQRMEYEKKRFFTDIKYDIAISYYSGYTAEFVMKNVQAKKKIAFYHSSTDDQHHLHESIYPSFDKIIAVNSSVRNNLSKWYPHIAEKITVIENFVDYQEVRTRASELTIPKQLDVTILCSCGRLSNVKGFDLAVGAAVILKENNIPFVWYFVGDGPERQRLQEAIINKALEKHIIITGMLDNPYPYMKACDIYVQPSYEESFGLTITEAKILYRPVVSTNTVGAKEQIVHRKNGYLSDINSESLASGIMQLITEKALRQTIIAFLHTIDYLQDYDAYKTHWENLLAGQI